MTAPAACVPKHRLEVLTINNDQKDCASLQSIMGHTNWTFHGFPDLVHAMQWLETNPTPVIVCRNELPGATWRDVLAAVRRFPHPPELLVYATHADDSLWMEVLKAGGYDLLPLPFNRDEVLRLISLAARKWRDDANAPTALSTARESLEPNPSSAGPAYASSPVTQVAHASR